jgi:hypothetical protein
VLPETSGLADEQLVSLRSYVRQGGQLLANGGAMQYDTQGKPRQGFALKDVMGENAGVNLEENLYDFEKG